MEQRLSDIRKEMVIERLRERGYRITKQRQVLLDVILGQDCTSCKEMYYKAAAKDSAIGVATVYRMVNLLEDIGAFHRKNMYEMSVRMECSGEDAYMIEFEDSTYCRLTSEEWRRVLGEGLKACNLGGGKKVSCVIVEASGPKGVNGKNSQ